MLGQMIWGPLRVREVGRECGKNRARALPSRVTAFTARSSVGHGGRQAHDFLLHPNFYVVNAGVSKLIGEQVTAQARPENSR